MFLTPTTFGYTTDRLYQHNVGLGNGDADWAVFNTCRFLNSYHENQDGRNDEPVDQLRIEGLLKQMCRKGLHLVCGWKTRMDMNPGMGQYFVERLRARDFIKDAWIATTRQHPRTNGWSIGRVFGAENSKYDYLCPFIESALSPVLLSRDPLDTDSFAVVAEYALYNP